jgi:hypothetical protein
LSVNVATPQGSQLFLQFITRYLHYSGQLRCRVTTLTRFWTDGSNSADLINGFDQETAAALMARLATYKMETEDDFDPTRFLDRSLIRLCQRWVGVNSCSMQAKTKGSARIIQKICRLGVRPVLVCVRVRVHKKCVRVCGEGG